MGAGARQKRVEYFERHQPDDEEVLRAIRAPQSAAYWNSLAPHSLTSSFEEQVRVALLEGGFHRVSPSQLTPRVCEDPAFEESVLGPSFPTETVPFTKAGHPGFFSVHRAARPSGITLEFGFLTELSGTPFFRQMYGVNTFTNVRDPYRSWPACNVQPDCLPPVSASLFWKRS